MTITLALVRTLCDIYTVVPGLAETKSTRLDRPPRRASLKPRGRTISTHCIASHNYKEVDGIWKPSHDFLVVMMVNATDA